MESKIKEAIKNSTIDTFTTMLGMEIEVENEISREEVSKLKFDVSGIIGLAGGCVGIISIHMPQAVAMKLTGAMLGMEVSELTAEVEDCIGEIANMVAGGAKTTLVTQDVSFEISLPTVVTGLGHSTNQVEEGGYSRAIIFKTENGPLTVVYMVKVVSC